MSKIQLLESPVLELGTKEEPPGEQASWLTMPPNFDARSRLGLSNAYVSGESGYSPAGTYYNRQYRELLPYQYWKLYRTSPDVRACVDSITRRVSTWDWYCKPNIDPSDPRYLEILEVAKKVQDWLIIPNEDNETWQELTQKFVLDILLYDSGVIEKVKDANGDIKELVAYLGCEFFPIVDPHGSLMEYVQITEDWSVPAMKLNGEVIINETFPKDDILYFKLFPNTRSSVGFPLLESVINECMTVLLGSQHAVQALDADEVPPGILVIGGIAGAAADRAKAELKALRGKDHKIRLLNSAQPDGVDAKWVELRHTPKDLEMIDVLKQMQRAIWRVFGVMPVELGEMGTMPRATANAQLDVSSSHLIVPILELIQAKYNNSVIPEVTRLFGEEYVGLINFHFDRESRLTATEQYDMARKHEVLVKSGIMTINEARFEAGLMPVDGGDTNMIETALGPMSLQNMVDGITPADVWVSDKQGKEEAETEEIELTAIRAVGDKDPTNFPKKGDNKKVSLRNSEYAVFDRKFAEMIKNDYPEIWRKGGNTLGNKQYSRLINVLDKGEVESETDELAVRLREAWSARHYKDFRIAGVIAQIKWLTVGSRGEAYMKDLVREQISKLKDK